MKYAAGRLKPVYVLIYNRHSWVVLQWVPAYFKQFAWNIYKSCSVERNGVDSPSGEQRATLEPYKTLQVILHDSVTCGLLVYPSPPFCRRKFGGIALPTLKVTFVQLHGKLRRLAVLVQGRVIIIYAKYALFSYLYARSSIVEPGEVRFVVQ